MTESSKMHEIVRKVTPEVCRAARGGLGWSQRDLAERCGIGRNVLVDFESGVRTPRQLTLNALCETFEAAGLHLIETADGRLGLLLPVAE